MLSKKQQLINLFNTPEFARCYPDVYTNVMKDLRQLPSNAVNVSYRIIFDHILVSPIPYSIHRVISAVEGIPDREVLQKCLPGLKLDDLEYPPMNFYTPTPKARRESQSNSEDPVETLPIVSSKNVEDNHVFTAKETRIDSPVLKKPVDPIIKGVDDGPIMMDDTPILTSSEPILEHNVKKIVADDIKSLVFIQYSASDVTINTSPDIINNDAQSLDDDISKASTKASIIGTKINILTSSNPNFIDRPTQDKRFHGGLGCYVKVLPEMQIGSSDDSADAKGRLTKYYLFDPVFNKPLFATNSASTMSKSRNIKLTSSRIVSELVDAILATFNNEYLNEDFSSYNLDTACNLFDVDQFFKLYGNSPNVTPNNIMESITGIIGQIFSDQANKILNSDKIILARLLLSAFLSACWLISTTENSKIPLDEVGVSMKDKGYYIRFNPFRYLTVNGVVFSFISDTSDQPNINISENALVHNNNIHTMLSEDINGSYKVFKDFQDRFIEKLKDLRK